MTAGIVANAILRFAHLNRLHVKLKIIVLIVARRLAGLRV